MPLSQASSDIRQIKDLLEIFFSCAKPLLGEIQFIITEPMNADIFPDELGKMGDNRNGVYLISSKNDHQIIYVGISTDIPGRIYEHIGAGCTWSKSGNIAYFPNCALAEGRHWLDPKIQQILYKAEWCVTAVFLTPVKVSRLIESLLIYMCEPEINVQRK